MNTSAYFNRLRDTLEHRGKAAAKTVYRRPTIEAARIWRRMLRGTRFIGVTGSAGKTTTKELLYRALAGRFRCVRSADSNNQLYSIARTLLSVGRATTYCVQEVGVGERGAFDSMMRLLRPQVGVVTNVGADHYKLFRGREGVAAEKGKLIACLPADGLAILNADDDLVATMAANCRARVVTYGLQQHADFQAEIVTHRWPDRLALRIRHGNDTVLAPTQLLGSHQAGSALAAIATACSLGVPLAEAALAMKSHEPLLGRMSVQQSARGVIFIRDDWKAPLMSLDSVWQFMGDAVAARKLIVLATISDYGGNSTAVYRRSVTKALAAADSVLLVGARAKTLQPYFVGAAGHRLHGFDDVQAATQWLQQFSRPGDLVLLKGSNHSDHLSRLALAFDLDVRCWRARCGRHIFCDRCRLIGDAAVT